MNNITIPTAEEFLYRIYYDRLIAAKKDAQFAKMIADKVSKNESQKEYLIEFAKIHVKAALEAAGEKLKNSYYEPRLLDIDEIINAYPESNIK